MKTNKNCVKFLALKNCFDTLPIKKNNESTSETERGRECHKQSFQVIYKSGMQNAFLIFIPSL